MYDTNLHKSTENRLNKCKLILSPWEDAKLPLVYIACRAKLTFCFFDFRTETTSRSWGKMCWDAVEEINIQSPVSGTGKIFNNAPLDRVRKINVNLSLRGISLFKNFDNIPKLASLKQLSFGGIDGATEPKVRETVKFMTWIQALQLRYTKKIQPNVFDLLSRHTSLKKIVLGHASSLASKSDLSPKSHVLTTKLIFQRLRALKC